MASPERLISFSDFQRILTDNNGKAIYEKRPKSYILEWLGGSFLYQTEILTKDIVESYFEEVGERNEEKACKLFEEKYLKDCFQILDKVPSDQRVTLVKPANPRVEQGQWKVSIVGRIKDFKPDTFLILETGGKRIVQGETKDGQIGPLLILERG